MGKKSSFKKILGIKLTKRNIIIVSVVTLILFTAIGLGLGLKKRNSTKNNSSNLSLVNDIPTTSTTTTTTTTQPTTTTTQATTTTTQAEENGLSTGAIVGIVVACIVILPIGVYYLYWHLNCKYGTGRRNLNIMAKCHSI